MMCHDDADLDDDFRLTPKEAYIAMYRFVDGYWQRGGRRDGSVTLLRHALGPTADPLEETALQTADPASWSDWLMAIAATRAQGLPDEL
jgi:hypothetical protein